MKKNVSALFLALALVLSLAACGGKDAPAQDGAPDVPAVSAPGDGESDSPEPGAEAPEEAPQVSLTDFYSTLREEGTWPELMSLTEDETMKELLDSYYPGLSELSTRQCGVYVAAISAAVGELALVEVENAEDVQKVKDIFQARIDYQVGDDANPGGAWYPETIEGWKNKSVIAASGNYVMLAVGDASGEAEERFLQLFP